MADLFGTYDKRIKFTADHTKIDADVTWFPVMAQFGQLQATAPCNYMDRQEISDQPL